MSTNERMNAVAAGIAADLGITQAEAAALLVHALRTQGEDLKAAVATLRQDDSSVH